MDIPWPEKGDTVFHSSDTMTDAWIHPSNVNFVVYAEAYLDAAERLVKSAVGKRFDGVTLIFPILFLYRHHVELQLKFVISAWRRYSGQDGREYMHHDLTRLWAEVETILKEMPDDGEDAAPIVKAMIRELADYDPMSFTFRYPVDKHGRFVVDEQRFVSLDHLAVSMRKLSNYLDALGSQVVELAKGME